MDKALKKKKEGKKEGGKIEKGRFTLDLSLFFILPHRYLNLPPAGQTPPPAVM